MLSKRLHLFLAILSLASLDQTAHAFSPVHHRPSLTTTTTVTCSTLYCICVNCARVTNCKAYHFVETKHEQPHMTDNPTFMPADGSPTIHVNVRNHKHNNEQIARIWKEHQAETARAEQKGESHGETVYDLTPSTTVEYDVVACQDFVLDKGCWVRNMPEEIRKANPDFVPT